MTAPATLPPEIEAAIEDAWRRLVADVRAARERDLDRIVVGRRKP